MRFVRLLAAYDGEVRCDHKKKATYYLRWSIERHGPRILALRGAALRFVFPEHRLRTQSPQP
jgi:hypothetical protein